MQKQLIILILFSLFFEGCNFINNEKSERFTYNSIKSDSVVLEVSSPISQRDTTTEVVEVRSLTGRIWMDRNLGAKRVAERLDDEEAYGDLYQWGRGADGHQNRNSSTTTKQSNTDQPGHSDFIANGYKNFYDWRRPSNDYFWHGTNGVNNPCPKGFQVPTLIEWEKEFKTWNIQSADGAFNSPLKLVTTSSRSEYNGGLGSPPYSDGVYWTSTIIKERAADRTGLPQSVSFGILRGDQADYYSSGMKGLFTNSSLKMSGCAVRCIKE